MAAASDDRTQGIQLGDTISPDNSSGDYASTGFDFAELTSAIDDTPAHGQPAIRLMQNHQTCPEIRQPLLRMVLWWGRR